MYRVLIADDEPIVLEGMRLYPWEQDGCVLVGEAEDGDVALQMVRQLDPDIVISDIRMPERDGLALAHAIHQTNPRTEILFVTGFSEFTYAQQALRIGVVDFLVKPVSFEALHEALVKATGKLKEKAERLARFDALSQDVGRMLPKVQEQVLMEAIEGTYEAHGASWSLDKEQFVMAALFCDSPKGLEVYMLHDYLLRLTEQENALLVYEFRRYLVLFRFPRDKEEASCRLYVEKRIEQLQLEVWKQYRFTFSAGVSMTTHALDELPALKQQALTGLSRSRLAGKNLVFTWQGGTLQALSPERLSRIRTELVAALQSRDSEGLRKAMDVLGSLMEDSSRGVALLHALWEEILCLLPGLPPEFKARIPSSDLHSYLGAMRQGLEEVRDELSRQDLETQKEVGVIVENYIKAHYAQDISLSTLSQELCYNTAYLSRLVSKHCGQSFLKMLTSYRLEKAKELLKTSDELVGRIAVSVGFNDVGYFITTFRKHEGMTPAEYRLHAR